MKTCIINENIVNNIRDELEISFVTSKFKLDQSNIKTYTEKYVNSFFDTSSTLVEFYFINLNADAPNNVEIYNYESKTVILKKYVRPIRTIILWLDDECLNNKFIITNVDDNAYKYKLFRNETSIHLLNPCKAHQIDFNGNYFYGKIKVKTENSDIPNYALIINVFNEMPNYINSLKIHSTLVNETHKLYESSMSNNTEAIIIENNFVSYDFFDNLLYNKNIPSVYLDILTTYNDPHIQIIKSMIKKEPASSCKNDILMIIDPSNNIGCNRFLQRFTKNIYSPITCKWIIDEYSKCNSHTNSISIEKMPNIFSYVVFSFKEIIDFFIKSYCVDSDINISITSGEIIKYKSCDMVDLGGFGVSCLLLLSNKASIVFNDGLNYELTQGDVLLYKKQEFGLKCLDECCYIALFYITVSLLR